ncbi:MAG: DUF748 domain-containing protein [Planctomycetota bacterium]|nr:MAG: DUF748 domain-containing protein [Planctomycetota bacterium]
MKIFRTGLLVLVLLVVVLVAGTLLLAGDPLFASALRTYGPGALGQPLDFGDASLSILGGSAAVEDLRIGSTEEPVAEARSVALDASTLDLLSGRLHIEEAVLDGAVLHLVIDEQGRLSIDPGPPPPEVVAEKPPRERPGRKKTPPEERDFVQIVQEYWERLQDYREYYDQVGSILGGGEGETPEEREAREARQRSRHPGRASYLGEAEADGGLSFWLGHAALTDFRWETLDQRTGGPVLPPLASLTLTLDRLGDAPAGVTEPASIAGRGELADGGRIDFALDLARDGGLSRLRFEAAELPAASIMALAAKSLPYELESGFLGIQTRKLRFGADHLEGRVKLELRDAVVRPGAGAKEVLGMKPQEFCKLLNHALAAAPVAFDFALGGSPTEPTFAIENQSDLKDILTGAVKAEAEGRAKELIDQKKDELLGGKDAGDVLGGLLGGKEEPKKGGKKNRKKRGGGGSGG